MHILLHTSFVIIVVELAFTNAVSFQRNGPNRVHSGRIPANVKIFYNKRLHRPLEDKGLEQLLANSLPANDLTHEHKLLYYRSRQNDYDFAQFGKPCRKFSLDELEAFLKIPKDTIEPKEGERETISPAQKGDLLEKLFNHSKTICDFRNLLTCHRQFRTCACPPSMGLNRDGICGVNLGHPCEFSQRSLLKYDILLTPETNPIKCLMDQAECVLDIDGKLGSEISPIRKVCKCMEGFWGATCRRPPGQFQGHLLPAKDSSQKDKSALSLTETGDHINGRRLWVNSEGDLGEYMMHPEEIVASLVELMKSRQMYPPENRQEEAEKLVKRMELDIDKEEMVVHELHLRRLARLVMGETCDPDRQLNFDNPPVAKDGQRWIDPNSDDIKSWQLGHLQDKRPFCNIHKHFRCDETTRTCQCKPGLKLEAGSCVIPLGHNCGPDFETFLEFDPLRDRKRFSEGNPPDCMSATSCKDQPFFFQKKCWCKQGQNCSTLFDEDAFQNIVLGLKSRFTLAQGDSCDPALHQHLLNSGSDNGVPSHEKRMSLFREIIKNSETRLCDITNYLNCSETSRKCVCMKFLTPNSNGECVAINMGACGKTFEFGKYLYHEGSQLWQVEKTLQTQFSPECIPDATCAGGDDLDWAGRCVCKERGTAKTGEDCSDKQAILATAFKPRLIPSSNDDEMKMIRVYFDLNQHTYLLEQLMTLTINHVCDPKAGLKLDRIVKFWKEVASSDDRVADKRSLPHFIALAKWTKYLVSFAGSTAALCNATMGLRCDGSSEQCRCALGSRWIGDKCYLDIDEPCDPKPGAKWIPTCINGSKCLSVKSSYSGESTYQCGSCSVGVNCDDKEDVDENEDDIVINEEEEEPIIAGRRVEGEQDLPAYDEEEESVEGVVVNTSERMEISGNYSRTASVSSPKSYISKQRQRGSGITSGRRLGADISYESGAAAEHENLTVHQRVKYTDEINRMLKEILFHRVVPFHGKCETEDEKDLSEILPRLPIIDMNHLPKTLSMTYSILSRLFWKGTSFCDRNLFSNCASGGVCGCSEGFGLIEQGGECRLKERVYCTEENGSVKQIPLKRSFPKMKCERGTKCLRLDHGMAVCSKSLVSGAKLSSITKLEILPVSNVSVIYPKRVNYFILMSSMLILKYKSISL